MTTQWKRWLVAGLLMCGWLSGDAATEPNAYVDFSFDDADIRLVVKLVGEITGRRFILDEQVLGTVTVVTPPQIPREQVYPFLLTVLQSRGFSVVERNGLHHVVPLPARELPDAPVVGVADDLPPDGVVTRVLQARHVSALELRRLLEPMVPGAQAGALRAFGPTNHLIITAPAETIRRIEKVVAEIDREGAHHAIEVVKLQHADAHDLAQQLTAALQGAESAGGRLTRHMQQITEGAGGLAGEALVVPAAHANQLLLVGAPMQISELIRLVKLLGVETPSDYGRLNVIFLKYLNAQEAAESLNALFAKSAEQEARPSLAVEPSVANNALLVDAAPRDFDVLRGLVERLDLPPQQVMVEILIAEVSLGKSLDLGVEWATVDAPESGRTTVIGRSRPGRDDTVQDLIEGMFPEGLTVGVARGTFTTPDGQLFPRVPFLLRALAEDRDVKILSNIPLWAQNNMEASVHVVDNIPILTSTIEGGAGTARDVIQNIERVDVGIQLKVTPYVNPDREVRMKLNPIIEAIIDEGRAREDLTPTIARREVDTTVTIPDRATVVISGLMREDRQQTVSKVPLLGDIPLLGALFRRNVDRTQRTNLLIFVTPHIVADLEDAARLRDAMEARTDIDHRSVILDWETETVPTPELAPGVDAVGADGEE